MKHNTPYSKLIKNELINSNIKKIILTIITPLLLLTTTSCSTTNCIMASPPESYHPTTPTTDKELIKEWQRSLMKIKEWQSWYNISKGLPNP